MSKRKPFASQDFIDLLIWNDAEVSYQTDPPGRLAIGRGKVKLQFRLDFDHGGDPKRIAEGMVNVACFHRLTDSAGAIWEARTCMWPRLFVNRLLDLDSIDRPCWEHNDPERAKALAKRPLLTGLEMLLDDRFYRWFWLDNTLVEVQFKYQGITIDIGMQDEMKLVVRLGGFFGHWSHVPVEEEGYVPQWTGGVVRPPHSDWNPRKKGEKFLAGETPGADHENLSPILFTLYASELLFRNDATWTEDGYPSQASELPRSLVWRRVEGQRKLLHRK